MFIIEFSGSRFQQPGNTQERLDEHFVVQPVKAPGVVPPGAQQTARRTVGDGGHQSTFTQPQPGSQQNADRRGPRQR